MTACRSTCSVMGAPGGGQPAPWASGVGLPRRSFRPAWNGNSFDHQLRPEFVHLAFYVSHLLKLLVSCFHGNCPAPPPVFLRLNLDLLASRRQKRFWFGINLFSYIHQHAALLRNDSSRDHIPASWTPAAALVNKEANFAPPHTHG